MMDTPFVCDEHEISKSERKHIKKFYAVVTDEAVGIFTEWKNAERLIRGRKNKNKSFTRYEKARQFLLDNLLEEDIKQFGLDKTKPPWDKVIKRKLVWK